MSEKDIKNSDEIDLLDLVAVLLRYRFHLLGIIALSIVVTTASYIIIPRVYIQSTGNQTSITAKAHWVYTPEILSLIDGSQLVTYSTQILTDPEIIDGNILKAEQNNNGLNLFLTTSEIENYKDFYHSIIDQVNIKISGLVQPIAEGKVWEFENVTLKQYPFAAVDPKMVHLYNQYTLAYRFTQQKVPAFIMIQEPSLLEEYNITGLKKSILKKGIIISITVFLLGIILAFILNWIDLIKNDEESMNKLREAYRKNRN